jgi:phosphoenolpyruvate carboxykinase (ATP)
MLYENLNEIELVEEAIKHGEGKLGKGGSLLVFTGEKTGRSPKDKHIVREKNTEEKIWWENNRSMSTAHFDTLHRDMLEHQKGKRCYSQALQASMNTDEFFNIEVTTELAWHSLFIRHLLKVPSTESLNNFKPDFKILNCPSFFSDPNRHGCVSKTTIAISFEKKLVLICGTGYAGENKKSVFTLLNFLLPERSTMPMHCSANHSISNEDDVALFFGLSGTGKTTLSADPDRVLIGDDEHGWSEDGVFNMEGGCYAKTINLSYEDEPQIFSTTEKFSTVIENMTFESSDRSLKFTDSSITENMRCAYPISYIENSSKSGYGGTPKNIILLTCDAFGVLPPVARLTPAEAVFYFLSGFTSKVAGTEDGIKEPVPTFSTCFGAPFMPQKPEVYGQLLWDKINKAEPTCWLLNTGWSGGSYGKGKRISIELTRKILKFILSNNADFQTRTDQFFNFSVPIEIDDVPKNLLDPRANWTNGNDYDKSAAKLRSMFVSNFHQFSSINEKIDGVYNHLKND